MARAVDTTIGSAIRFRGGHRVVAVLGFAGLPGLFNGRLLPELRGC
jgi:hypothetical protein